MINHVLLYSLLVYIPEIGNPIIGVIGETTSPGLDGKVVEDSDMYVISKVTLDNQQQEVARLLKEATTAVDSSVQM